MSLEADLISETEKWKVRLQKEIKKTAAGGEKGRGFLENITAYASDSDHFMKKKDYVRSFEAIVWAWAWLEIGKETGVLKNKK